MSPSLVLIAIIGCFIWLFLYRFRDNLLRAYGVFFLILIIYATNKAYYGISPEMSESTFSPLSLVRWGALIFFAWYSWRVRFPANYRADVVLSVIVFLLLSDMLLSSLYAENFSYSFFRAISFVLLAYAVMKGMVVYIFGSANCIRFFQLKYYTAWIMLVPAMAMLLSGFGYGITIIMNQYAGFFGNQNMFGTFSALMTPYVLFHWRVIAKRKWEKWADIILLLVVLAGLWFSNSRNGMSSCVVAVTVYFFVVNLQNRIKIVLASACLLLVLSVSQTLKSDLVSFVRKGTDKSAQVTDFVSQMSEEERFKMWSGVWPLFWKQKLTGYGFASSHLLVFPFTRDEEAGRALHNSYLEIFGDLGLPGLVLLLLLFYQVAAKSLVLIQQRGEFLERSINAVFISVFVAGSANALFESWMFSVGNLTSLLYWVPVAGIVARWAWSPANVNATSYSGESNVTPRFNNSFPQQVQN
ncbi:MAG TPA: O-antigen ligase family protein [Blastocatellia bacterium]|nr:O-antigen ligase family protein [Blastocatellia bacterium]